jgi:vitamin B12 transporter
MNRPSFYCAHHFTLLASLICLIGEAKAQLSLVEEVIVSAKVPQSTMTLNTSVSILSEERILTYGNQSLQTILQQLPSIHLNNNGGMGKASSLSIRGADSYRTLLLLDGLKLSDSSAPQVSPRFEHLLSSGIERVELLRGPQGLAYGADSGGVVSVTTVIPEPGIGASLSLEQGSFETNAQSANFSYGNDTFSGSFILNSLNSAGYNSRVSDRTGETDGYQADTLHTRLVWKTGPASQLQLIHRQQQASTEFDRCYSSSLEGNSCRAIHKLIATRLANQWYANGWEHSLSLTRTSSENNSLSDHQSIFRSSGELKRVEYLSSKSLHSSWRIVTGFDYEEASNSEFQQKNSGAFVDLLFEQNTGASFNLGLRNDRNAQGLSVLTYRAGASLFWILQPNNTIKLRASHGTGFRSPSPYEQSYNTSSWASSPATEYPLMAEFSRGTEIGLTLQWPSNSTEIVVFNQSVADPISFDLINYSGYLQNTLQQTMRGVEVSNILQLHPKLNWEINYSYLQATQLRRTNKSITNLSNLVSPVQDTDFFRIRLPRRPKHSLNTGLLYRHQTTQISFYLRSANNLLDETATGLVEVDDYVVSDLNLSRKLRPNLRTYLRIENLFNEDYIELLDFNTSKRSIYVGFNWLL